MEDALQRAHDELEARVQERTAELMKTNELLNEEISERKHAERLLLESKKQAEAANKIKSAFLANMSHEIRTPLNAITGFSELMENTSLDYVQKDYVSVIRESGKILLALINDILDLSKIEAGEMHLEHIDFDLEYLIRSVIKINSPKLEGKQVELFCNIDEHMPKDFRGDPTRVRQILINLLSNAIKFTEQGSITISVYPKDRDVPKDKLRNLEFSVRDTGIGIPPEKHESIFAAFEQADTSTTRKYGGTGLGLTICKGFVEMMGGSIRVVSEPGKGSEFIFSLRLEEVSPIVSKDIAPVKIEELKEKKVLIVDDSESARRVIEDYCLDIGMDVLFKAPSANVAWEWLLNQTALPDIIISDIVMQGMSGYDFARSVREDERLKNIRMISVTTDIRPGAAKKAQMAGFDAYLPKPVIRSDFIRIVQTTLGDKRQNKENEQIVTRHMAEELACKGFRILVVEDNAVNQKLLQIVLKNLGCETDFASNGQIAVEKVRTGRFDLVLMDLQMPVMGGCEATRIIRAEISKTLPVIALTAAAMKEDEENSLAAGMNDYVTKPVELHKLKEKIIQWGKRSV
jgi:signal transduction histidine kinase/DNA-binding response OmpR family regulator